MGDKAKSAGIFNECAVSFVPGTLLTPSAISELAAAVKDNGGEVYEPRRDGSLRLDEATHIISNTIDFPQYAESQAFMIPVVTADWVTVSLARRRQAIVRPYSPDPRLIFSSLVVTCADLPLTDKESIIGATLAMGGSESKDVNRTTTHICALSMDHPKVKAAVDAKLKAKIVLPHWFDDCFKLGKRIDEGPYLLPDPEILNTPADASLEVPTNESLIGATSPNPVNLPIPSDSDSVRPPCTVFQDKRVMISWDVVTSSRQRLMKVVEQVIVNGGGKMVDEVEDCDIFICHYRDGPHYVQAAQSCKDVGNLAWLYHLIVHNEWTSPFKRLLHYPIPKDGIEGFKNMRITVSNYGGEARIYLESLIKACGAEYTRTMKQDNTHLVTARDTSEKCIVAPEWGISVINHLWLEESYAKCEVKPLTIKKYTHFPPRTNLGEIIGQTPMDESRLRALYYPGGEDKMSADARTRRKILDVADENTYGYGPGEGILKTPAEVDKDSFDIMRDGNGNGAEPKTKSRKSKTATTPVRSDRVSAGKENATPSAMSTGDRSAKAKARDKLQHIAPDIALYEKEKKRHSKSGPWGGKRAADTAEKEKEKDTKRATTHDAEDEDEEDEEVKRPAKKARPSLPAVEMRVILTGYTRWVGSRKKEDAERKKLRNLGIQIVPEGSPCDYVAAPQIIRTVKFICALARGATAISSDFITAVIESGELLTPEDYPLKDTENEKKYDIKLTKSVARAKAHRGRLLWSVAVYCTDKIRNGPDSYRSVAEANGAIFKLYRARSGTTIRPTTEEEDGGRAPEPVYLLSSMSSEEKAMWPRFKQMAENGHMEPRIVAPDWLLDVAMAQEVRFDKKFLVENFYAES